MSFTHVFLVVFLERKRGITGVPFGRTELSICGNGKEFCALLRREGPEGPGVQGMPEKFDFHVFFKVEQKKQKCKNGSEMGFQPGIPGSVWSGSVVQFSGFQFLVFSFHVQFAVFRFSISSFHCQLSVCSCQLSVCSFQFAVFSM